MKKYIFALSFLAINAQASHWTTLWDCRFVEENKLFADSKRAYVVNARISDFYVDDVQNQDVVDFVSGKMAMVPPIIKDKWLIYKGENRSLYINLREERSFSFYTAKSMGLDYEKQLVCQKLINHAD